MRLSDILQVEVHDHAGARVGDVADLTAVRDGPLDENGRPAFRITGLVVIEGRHSRLMGYSKERRPVVFRWFLQRLAKNIYTIPWENIETMTPELVTLTVDTAHLETDPH